MRFVSLMAAAGAASLFLHTSAIAQMTVDQAHAVINSRLNGAGVVLVFSSGKTLDGVYGQISNVRTVNRCMTRYDETRPYSEELPESERGSRHPDNDFTWDEVNDMRAADGRFYWTQIRPATGRPFTYFFQLDSQGAAEDMVAAAKVLLAACGSGGKEKPNVPEQAAQEVVHDEGGNSGSLAIDRKQGTRYGWAIDYASWDESDARALSECQRSGGNCQIVLRFTGGCGAYAADQAKGSTVYGWGTARNRQAAESRARSEAQERGSTNTMIRVWGCNSVKAAGAAPKVQGGTAMPGKGKLSEDVIRRNEEAAKAHQAQVDAYQQKLKDNEAQVARAVAERKANDAAYQAELAKAQAAQAEFERQRQAYREEYRRVTGKYPDE